MESDWGFFMKDSMYMKLKLLILAVLIPAFLIVSACDKKAPVDEEKTPTTPQITDIEPKTAVEPEGKFDLKIFYAGHRGSDREKEFVAFLKKHFAHVETGDLGKFDGSQADAVDVTILDYDGTAPEPSIPEDYTAATITMGVAGAKICSSLGLATGYM